MIESLEEARDIIKLIKLEILGLEELLEELSDKCEDESIYEIEERVANIKELL